MNHGVIPELQLLGREHEGQVRFSEGTADRHELDWRLSGALAPKAIGTELAAGKHVFSEETDFRPIFRRELFEDVREVALEDLVII